MDDLAIGIDLGTTNSCAAYYANDRLNIIINREGGRITPSVVFYTEKKGTAIGKYAKKLALEKPQYAVYEIKRLVGRKTDDPYVQSNLKYFPFKLDSNSNEPLVVIEHPNNHMKKTPEEVCAAILKKIKIDVEEKIGHSVDKAVITVPAYFNINQREATLLGATKAGFTVLKLLNEPTAAALSYYYLENNCNAENYSLVYDLGGGTFDVAILKKSKNNIEVLGVDGDSHLGGQDFDNLIKDYVCHELKRRFNYNARSDRRTMRRLHNHCEEAKETLSVTDEAPIILEGFVRDQDVVEIMLTRDHFNAMCNSLFQKTIRIVSNCLKSCNLPKSAIKEVILSGGSTRIIKIQEMLQEFFEGKTLNHFVNPDECVAEGAALQAAMLNQNPRQSVNHFEISDVTALSLGVGNFVGLMSFMIDRNTRIPVSVSQARVNVNDQQEAMTFSIYEGERFDVRKNYCLAKLTISDITPAPPGQCSVTITMSIDNNGILTVAAKEKYKNNYKDLKVSYTRGRRSDKEVKNALKDAEENKEEDKKFQTFAAYKEYLLDYCIQVAYNLKKHKLISSYQSIYDFCKETETEGGRLDVPDEYKIRNMITLIENKCKSVVQEYNFQPMPVLQISHF